MLFTRYSNSDLSPLKQQEEPQKAIDNNVALKCSTADFIASWVIFKCTLFYKNIFYKNIEAEMCEILRILIF